MLSWKILYVEDDDKARAKTLWFIKKAAKGWSIDVAKSKIQGIDYIVNNNYDIIITDMYMEEGRKDGVSILDAAKNKNPLSELIVVTAYPELDIAGDVRSRNAKFLSKIDDNIYENISSHLKNIIKKKLNLFKIIVVDDEDRARSRMADLMLKKGFQVEKSSNDEEAFDYINNIDFDVVITDMRMSEDDSGLKILKAVKEKNILTEVIIVTLFSDVQHAFKSKENGAFAYIEKDNEDAYDQLETQVIKSLKNKCEKQLIFGELSRIQKENHNLKDEIDILKDNIQKGLKKSDEGSIIEIFNKISKDSLNEFFQKLKSNIGYGILYDILKKILFSIS